MNAGPTNGHENQGRILIADCSEFLGMARIKVIGLFVVVRGMYGQTGADLSQSG